MNRDRRGFSLLELLVVLVISGALLGIVTVSFSRVQGQLGVRAAHSSFMSLHAQARAFSAERGEIVRFVVDEGLDEIRVEWTDPATGDDEVLNEVSVRREFNVDVTSGQGVAELCFTPRGVAQPACNSFDGTLRVQLQRGNRSTVITVLQLGQARELP